MQLAVASLSETGMRAENEDHLGFVATDTFGCFVLADGTGGVSGGGTASRVVVKALLQRFNTDPGRLVGSADWVIQAAREGLERGRMLSPTEASMNTTLAALIVDVRTRAACWAYLGDSRIYLFRGGRAHQLTHDHSVLRAMVAAGYAADEGVLLGGRNALYASVGGEDVPPDAVSSEPLALECGDIFLICSDGLWAGIDPGEMECLLADSETPEGWLEKLDIHIVNSRNPQQDNYSAMTIWVGEPIQKTRVVLRRRAQAQE